jgi:tetratricopeptide (TPR) repeat protein
MLQEEIKMKTVLAIAAIILIVGSAQAATIVVCPSGCDYTSIQAAVYATKPNDTIEVQSGTYNESVVLTKNILFNGVDKGSGEPIVNGDLYKNGFDTSLRGFSFQSVSSSIPYADNMTTPNTTIYWIEKVFENPSAPKAIASLKQILKTDPKNSWAWYRMGHVLYNAQRYDESIDAYNESLKLDPYYIAAWNNMGADFDSLKKYNLALEAYEKAIQLKPDYALAWNNKGWDLKRLGQTAESDAAFAKAEELGYTD